MMAPLPHPDDPRPDPGLSTGRPPRSAWIEVDLGALAHNFRVIRRSLPQETGLLYVVKDEAYGLGALEAAPVALAHGADRLAVYTLAEAERLRTAGVSAPILLMGERLPEELPWVLRLNLEPCIGRMEIARALDELARRQGRRVPVHIKVNTGMNRFGLPWRDARSWAAELARMAGLKFEGVLSHFAQSDEEDKTFARVQLERFHQCLDMLRAARIEPRWRHHCNSGGVLDLPEAHLDLVRVGLLAHGVYPSRVCRRLDGLRTVMSVKARVVAVQPVEPGDSVGYGMRWRAERPGRIGVLPIGYGDGFPRVRNEGHALIRGTRVPLVGGVAMDALTVDLTDLPDAAPGDEAVLMGRQGAEEISAHDLALLKRSVIYDLLAGWRSRMPRVYLQP